MDEPTLADDLSVRDGAQAHDVAVLDLQGLPDPRQADGDDVQLGGASNLSLLLC